MTDQHTQPPESYPSPPPNNGLPFYHPASAPAPAPGPHDLAPNGTEPHHGDMLRSLDGADTHREVPDDPQLRANLASMMGHFGSNYGALTSHIPAGPESQIFGNGSGSPETLGATPDKSRDKRTKVSRACDECRRKKIRCDAQDEMSTVPCTNCSRTNVQCAFSRQQLKRGPSKGYIKELAERLNTLEQQVHPPRMGSQHQQEIQQIQQAMAEGLQDFAYASNGLSDPRVGDKRSRDVAEALQNAPPPMMSNNGLNAVLQSPANEFVPRPVTISQPFWRSGTLDTRHDNIGLPFDLDPLIPPTLDWDESVIDEYYRIIHQTFPLLPSNKNRLRQHISSCPPSLREAFLAALDCLMRTFPTTTLPPSPTYPLTLKRTAELLAKYPFDNPSSHTTTTNLVYLQTMLLMALESDNHGPATIRGQAGPSRAEWLGRAAGVAGQLEINVLRSPPNQSILQGDRDSEERLARRVWWVLFILDRWHASSTADLLKLPENSVVLLPEDQILLGESTYHLARLSFIIGHLATILTTTKTPSTDVMSPSNPASALLGLTLAGEIDRFRESVESVWGSLNLVHLSYHHCHLLIKRLTPTSEPIDLLPHAVKVATVLNSRSTPVTPLNHHFGALAAMSLCQLADLPATRAQARLGLEHLRECLGEGRGLAGRIESEGWDGAVRELVVKKIRALEGGEGVGRVENWDPTALTRYGYLTALGQGVFGRAEL